MRCKGERWIQIESGDRLLEEARIETIVCIEHAHIRRRRLREPEILRGRQAPILGAEHSRARLPIIGQQPARLLVGRAVVHDKDLELLEGLRQHAVDGFVEVLAQVEARDDD